MSEDKTRFLDEWAEPIIFGALALACILIYGQTIAFDFINLDDQSYVYLNPAVMSGLNGKSIEWAFTAFHSSNWHPLTWIAHQLDVQLFGSNAGAHHAVNVILHLANACLAFVVFRSYTGAVWKSALIALLFAVHPAHVESVAWVSERKDVLSTMFWLLTMLAYLRYARSHAAAGSVLKRFVSPYFVLTFVLLALGLLAKPMLVTLPFVLLLLDLWPLKRIGGVRDLVPLIVEKLPFFALVAASSVVTVFAQRSTGAVLALEKFPIDGRILNATWSYVKYVFVLFYPGNLGVWYPFEQISTMQFVLALTVLLAITAAAVWQIRRRPYVAVGWFWFLGTLVPVIGLLQVGGQSMADRYTYVPYFGLFIILVWGIAELVERFDIDTRVATVASMLVIVVLGYGAFKQASYWKSSETLYMRTLSVTKENYFLMNLLCRHYIDKTPAEYAERRCTELLENTSNYLESHNTIGLLRVELGRYDDALEAYRRALQVKPNSAIVYSNMSVAYSRKGDTEQAEKHLQRAIGLADPSLSREALAYSLSALGEAYARKNDPLKARASFESALKYNPALQSARDNLANLQGASK